MFYRKQLPQIHNNILIYAMHCSDSSSESESAEDREKGTPEPPVASPIGQSPVPMETNEGESKTVERLFGEGLDLSSS